MKQHITIGSIALLCGFSAYAGTLVGTVRMPTGLHWPV